MTTLRYPAPVLTLLFVPLACESKAEKADTASSKASAAAAPTPTPSAVPAPTPEPAKPARVKKKLSDCSPANEVTVDNPALEQELRKKIPKESGAITKTDLKRLRSLNLSQLKELPELDPCLFTPMTGLKELFLGTGDYDDLSPLAGAVGLESLRASINQVKDLTPLAKMSKIDRLDLGRTQVSDLKPLAKLTTLTELQLDDTQIEDISPLAELTLLENLSIKRTKVKDASPLKGLKKLKFLYIGGTPLDDDPMSVGPLRANGTKVISD